MFKTITEKMDFSQMLQTLDTNPLHHLLAVHKLETPTRVTRSNITTAKSEQQSVKVKYWKEREDKLQMTLGHKHRPEILPINPLFHIIFTIIQHCFMVDIIRALYILKLVLERSQGLGAVPCF
jgi:hypothetical protein